MARKTRSNAPFKTLPQLILHGVGTYGRGGVIGPVQWPHHDLIVVTRGSARFEIDGQSHVGVAGDALLIPPRHRVVGYPADGGCVIWVQHFTYAAKADIPREVAGARPRFWRMSANGEWARALMARIRELQFDHREPAESTEARCLMALLLETLARERVNPLVAKSPAAARVHRVIEWVRNHPLPPLGVEVLAERTGLSTSQFRALFHRLTGASAGRFLRELRLREAERLLQESDLPIKEISNRLGYSDPVAFHRAFAHQTGQTPARFRSNLPRPL